MQEGPVGESDAAPDAARFAWRDLAGMGGECVFIGRTRKESDPQHGELVALDYDAYEPMARGVIEAIAREVARDHGCGFVGVRHSLGVVPVGAGSVIVRTLAGHRNEAFVACRQIIDRLKHEAPIWKRERWERGSTWQSGHPVAGQSVRSAHEHGEKNL